jgi:homeobox-leucine zipper protein
MGFFLDSVFFGGSCGEAADTCLRLAGHLEASTRGFDVNRAPSCAAGDDDEEQDGAAVSSSPNNSAGSFPTDFSARGQAAATDRACSRASDEDDGGSSRKKLRLSKEQSAFLEESFKEHATLNPVSDLEASGQIEPKNTFSLCLLGVGPDIGASRAEQKQKLALAKQLNLRPRQVEVWFQNRRARCAIYILTVKRYFNCSNPHDQNLSSLESSAVVVAGRS